MKCFVVLAVVAIALVTVGCASPQPTRSCSGRVTTDNGHVIRDEEDCVWGNKYAEVESQPTYGTPSQQPVYFVQQPPVVLTYPQLNLSFGKVVNLGVRAYGNQPRTITHPQRAVPSVGVRVNGHQHNGNNWQGSRP